jgi:putative transposase
MVVETNRPIASVARELGLNEGALGNWVNVYRKNHAAAEPPLTISERARLRELERENRELRMKAEFLGKRRLLRPGISLSDRYAFIDGEKVNYPDRAHVRMARRVEVRVLRMAGPAHVRHRRATRETQGPHNRDIRRVARDLRAPPGARRARPPRRAGRPRAGPRPHAGPRPAALPAAPVPATYRPATTDADAAGAAATPDLVGRDFTAERPGQKMVGDITYIPTWEGWLYLATVIGCCTRPSSAGRWPTT